MDTKFVIIPKKKKPSIEFKPVSTRLPIAAYEKLERLARVNNLNILELSQQMLMHCLREVEDDSES